MRFGTIAFAIVLLTITGCGALGIQTAAARQAECVDLINEFNRVNKSANEPATPERLPALVEEALSCMKTSDPLDAALSWHLNERDLPFATRTCLAPFVKDHPESFLIVSHNHTHRLETTDPHAGRWVDAMSACVPASYVLSDRLPPVYLEPENLDCYDQAYEPANLVPYFENINKFDERVVYSDWPEDDLRNVYGPMYGCAEFVRLAMPTEVSSVMSEQSLTCAEGLASDFLLFTRENPPPGFEEEYNRGLLRLLDARGRSGDRGSGRR